jgi:hypothetical protein
MRRTRKTASTVTTQESLIPFDATDFVRFERNLLQIGFFSSVDERRGEPPYIRKIEQNAPSPTNGAKMKVEIEFRSPTGLPSSADRDKFMAFLKICAEQRSRDGRLTNPIRFSGYRLIRELELTDGGAVYEDINSWGERMSDTTITSRQVIFLAATRKYANKTIHVFESFQRVGVETSGKKISEIYEVRLADWLLDNLNINYVIAEDFTVYKQLKRATAKGIFGPLHYWFKASDGKSVERDYAEFCSFLGIQSYSYISKIRTTMGKALDELVSVQYLEKWQIGKMKTKPGYKVILYPGEAILQSLRGAPKLRSGNPSGSAAEGKGIGPELNQPVEQAAGQAADLRPESFEALSALLAMGVAAATAEGLTREHDPVRILDLIEYLADQTAATSSKRSAIGNPAGMLIWYLRNDMTVPSSFVTSRRRRAGEEAARKQEYDRQMRQTLEIEYDTWKSNAVEAELSVRFPGDALAAKVKQVAVEMRKTDADFKRIRSDLHEKVARQIIAKEIRSQMSLPTFEDWVARNSQGSLFAGMEVG